MIKKGIFENAKLKNFLHLFASLISYTNGKFYSFPDHVCILVFIVMIV